MKIRQGVVLSPLPQNEPPKSPLRLGLIIPPVSLLES